MDEPTRVGMADETIRAKLSDGSFDVPDEIAPMARQMNLSSKSAEGFDVGYTIPEDELPIVVGVVGIDGKVRVDERDLEPGRYRVRAGAHGEIVGEISVFDPVVARKSNRSERRGDQRIRRYRLPAHPLGGLDRRSR